MKRIFAFIMLRKKLFVLGLVFAGFFGAIPILALGGHQLIEAVDSPAFCTSCHNVHYAEAVTFQASPHKEVACSSCHIGPNPKNLVMSKLQGLQDIIPAITGKYERPIATPLKQRRPSTETCEKCHWAEKFLGDVPRIKTTYGTDESNSKKTSTLVLKVGGGKEEVASGIHWHSTGKVWYLPLDDKRLEIGWVATENASGNVTVYIDPNRLSEITPERIQKEKRAMDCVDCHNRATHLFRSPDELVDSALATGSMDAKLPFIKREAMNALVSQNASLKQAYTNIEKIKDFYQSAYPKVYQDKQSSIDGAIAKLKEIAKLTIFPDGQNWNTYPSQSVHNKPDKDMQIDWKAISASDDSPGCFRCHGNLVKASTDVQSKLNEVLNGLNLQGLDVKALSADDSTSNSTGLGGFSLNNASGGGISSGNMKLDISTSDNATLGSDTSNNTSLGGISANNTGLEELNLKRINLKSSGPGKGKLDAECSTCHYSVKSPLVSPIAPATSHPIDGLDNCLVCHNPSGSKPFKTTHPWASNEACNSCHQSAPKLKTLPTSLPPKKAMEIPHSTNKLEDCLVCHSPTATSPIKKEHPWTTNDTCASCHKAAATPKPLPTAAPQKAPEIPHATVKLEDCLTCHGASAVKPFSTDHPWTTNDTCANCHKQASTLLSLPSSTMRAAPTVRHTTTGLGACSACHNQSGTAAFPADHAGRPDSFCTLCHQPTSTAVLASSSLPSAPDIRHTLSGLPGCSACHSGSGPAPFPGSHAGRPESFCLICHKVAAAVPTTPPAAPASLGIVVLNASQVNVTWVDNSNDETGFRIERATNNTFTTNLITTTMAANMASYSDISVSGGKTYYYRVFAYNTVGDSAASNIASAITPVPSTNVPAAPTSLTAAAASATQVNLTWVDNANNETGFIVERAGDSAFSTNVATATTGANAVSYSDTTVTGGNTYYYRVFASNAGGNSAASNAVSVTTAAAPIDAAALYTTYCASCHGANRQGGVGPALTTTALSSRTAAQVTSSITVGVGSMPGYSSSLSSAQISALSDFLKNTAVAVPSTPTSLAATAISAGQVNLTWADNANNESGYRIERATNNTFTTNLITATVAANSISYSDATVAGSTTYYYRVFAYNSTGDSAASNTASATTPASGASLPVAATSVAATAPGATQVNLTWVDNANNESGYRIERATNNTFTTNLATATAGANITSYNDVTVSGGITYYYRVYAYNSAGDSPVSNICSVTTSAAVIDAAALYSTSCASCHGANRQGGAGPALTTTALSSRTISQVTSTIANGVGSMPGYSTTLSSAQMDALAQWLKNTTVAVPSAPTSLAATAISAGQVNLTWLDNANNESGYRIERATNNTFSTNLITVTVAASSVSYSDTTVAGSTTYYYRVFAYNSTGDSAASNTASVTTPAPTVAPPSAPTSLAATATSATQVNLTWLDNANNESGYRIERATNNTFTTNLITATVGAGIASYSDTTVAGGTTYYYRVFAYNAGGNSAASNVVSVTTAAPVIDAAALYSSYCASCHGVNRQGGSATALTATALSGQTVTQVANSISTGPGSMPAYSTILTSAEINALANFLKGATISTPTAPTSLAATAISAGQVNLTWVDNANNESGYRVQRATNNTFTTNLITVTVAANSISYTDATVAGSTTYYYRVFAYNSTGDSAASNTASVTTPAPTVAPPSAPTSLTATATSATQVNLTWLDNASNESGYRIERATNNTFSTNLITATVGAGIASYSDTTVAGGTTYYYRVFAYNAGGNSAASNTVSVTTPAPVINAAALYSSYCASCHGANRQGGSGPGLSPAQMSGTSLSSITGTINNGTGSMPGYSSTLSSAQVSALAAWLKNTPATPTSVTATAASATQVNLAWVDNSSNEVGFRIERATNSTFTANFVSIAVGANIRSYSDSTVARGTIYYYRIFAYNSTGDSPASTIRSVTTPP